jgi:hypothetical protein
LHNQILRCVATNGQDRKLSNQYDDSRAAEIAMQGPRVQAFIERTEFLLKVKK